MTAIIFNRFWLGTLKSRWQKQNAELRAVTSSFRSEK
jgi:hypothetical protein